MSDTPKTDAAAALTSQHRHDDSFGDPEFGWVTTGFARELERENAALRAAAVEVCALARVWVTVWGDKLSAESIKRLGELEKQILKKGQP